MLFKISRELSAERMNFAIGNTHELQNELKLRIIKVY